MDADLAEKVVILLAGALLAGFGGWANELRGERRRRRARLEEAYLAWLNSQSVVYGRLKALAEFAQRKPASAAELESLLERFHELETEVHGLGAALNAALLYEPVRIKRDYLELWSNLYSRMSETLSLILRHHAQHESLKMLVVRAQALVANVTKGHENYVSDPARVAQLQEEAVAVEQEARHDLETCSVELCDAAKVLASRVRDLEEGSATARSLLLADRRGLTRFLARK